MKLTPLDIRKQEFDRTMRGYNPDEVQAFLQMLSDQWQEQYDERRRLDEKVRDLQAKIKHYEQVEEALQEALQTARENKEKTLEHARREAELILKEARAEADAVQQGAREEYERLKQEASQIGGRRSEIVARLRAFLMSEMELLARFEGEDPTGFIKMLPPERRKQLREAVGEDEERAEGDAAVPSSRHEEPSRQEEDAQASVPPEHTEESAASTMAAAPAPEASRTEDDETRDLPDYLDRFSRLEDAEARDLPQASQAEPETQEQQRDATPAAGRRANVDVGEQSEPGWIVHSLFSAGRREGERKEVVPRFEHTPEEAPPASGSDEGTSAKASEEEMKKIRRILNDME